MAHSTEHAPGTTSVSEAVRDWLKFENIDQFNDAYIEEIAQGMLKRWKIMKDAREGEILRAADDRETGYRNNFVKFWKAHGMDVDDRAAATAWQKIRAKAAQRYSQLRMQASAPPLPELIPIEENPAPTAEKPLAIMDPSKWAHWDSAVFSKDEYHRFASEFVPELAQALKQMSSDMAVRTFQMHKVSTLFMHKLLQMYANQYPDRSPEELRENIQGWLDERWEETLEAAQKLKLSR